MSVEKLQNSGGGKFGRSYIIKVAIVATIALAIALGIVMYAGGEENIGENAEFDIQYTDSGIGVAQTKGEPVGKVELNIIYYNMPNKTYSINIKSLNSQEIVITSEELYRIKKTQISWSGGENEKILYKEMLPEEHVADAPNITIDTVQLRAGQSKILNADDYVDSEVSIKEYQWDVLGKNVKTSKNILLKYEENGAYSGELSVTDSVGNTVTESFQIEANSPQLMLPFDIQSQANVGETVNFDATEFTTSDATSYTWNIAGTTYKSESVSHSFSTSGSKKVQLKVTDAFGYSESSSDQIIVSEGFDVSIDVNERDNGQVVLSADTDGMGSLFNWDFGDGETTTTSDSDTIHQYQSSGQYTVTLSVETESGRSQQSSKQIDIEVNNNQSNDSDDNKTSDDQSNAISIGMDTPTPNDWSVTNIQGTSVNNILPNNQVGDYNPELQLTMGKRYTITGLESENPFELRDVFGDPILSQEVSTSYEDSDKINWVDNGNEVSFTVTQQISEWVDGYQSYSERANMDGSIEIVDN